MQSRIARDAFNHPVVENYVPGSRAAELAGNVTEQKTVRVKPHFDAEEYALLSRPRPIPNDRKNVRIVGPSYLPEAVSEVEFSEIAKSEPGFVESMIHQVVAFIGTGFMNSGETKIADAAVDPVTTAAVMPVTAPSAVEGADLVRVR